MSVTVHIVFNAHLDPIWLWPWTAGMDAAVATCRSACDRLDAHRDIVFSRGEAWVYQLIERIDPALFERMRGHVAAGRWEIVGGWWVQPDCNLPTGEGFRQQIGRDARAIAATAMPELAETVPGLLFADDRALTLAEVATALDANLSRALKGTRSAHVPATRVLGWTTEVRAHR